MKEKTTTMLLQPDENGTHYFQLKNTPAELVRILELFEAINKALRTRRSQSWLFFLVLLGVTAAGYYFLSTYNEELSAVTWSFMFGGILGYLVLFFLYRMFSRNPIVNPNRIDAQSTVSLIRLSIVSLGVSGLVIYFLVNFGFVTISRIPNGINNPIDGVMFGGMIVLSILTLGQFFTARRYGKIVPRTFELTYAKELLLPLLREVPLDAKCQLVFNPFVSNWSKQTMKMKKGKDATYDCLFKARLPLGGDRTISVLVMHRISQKGTRKFKGYKHKVKSTITMQSSSITPAQVKKIAQTDLKAVLMKDKVTKNPEGFGFPKFNPEIASAKGGITATFLNSQIKSMSPECVAADLIHPEVMLWTLKALSEAIS